MTQPRLITPGATYLLTRRTVLRYHLFAPDPQIRRVFLYTLAIAAQRTGVLVHSVTLMSTHPHLVVTDVEGRLPEFLHYLHRHVALATKVLRQWEGPVWDHEPPSVVELRTPRAVVETTAYAITNPVEAGLVWSAQEWPGINTRASDLGRAVWRIERPEQYFTRDDDRWPSEVELRLVTPRAASELGLDDDAFRALVANEVAELEKAARTKARERRTSFLGRQRCGKLSPFRRSKTPEPVRSRNPAFAVGRHDAHAFHEAVARLRAFRRAHRESFLAWRGGRRETPFPAGTWLMRHRFGALVEDRPRLAA